MRVSSFTSGFKHQSLPTIDRFDLTAEMQERHDRLLKEFQEIDVNKDVSISYGEVLDFLSRKAKAEFDDAEENIKARIKQLEQQIPDNTRHLEEAKKKYAEAMRVETMYYHGIIVDSMLTVYVREAKNLKPMDMGTSNPYVNLTCARQQIDTKYIPNDLNPVWDEVFTFQIARGGEKLEVVVFNKNTIENDDFEGQVSIPLSTLKDQLKHDNYYELKGKDPREPWTGKIRLALQWIWSKVEYYKTIIHHWEENIDIDQQELKHMRAQLQKLGQPFDQLGEAVTAISSPTLDTSLLKPQSYADNEPIHVPGTEAELQDSLTITVKCGLMHVRISQTFCEEVPCMISLKVESSDPAISDNFIDIVAVIDESGSMAGTRIHFLQQTLMKLIQLLSARDRLSIVTFSNDARLMCPLIYCSPDGKEKLKNIVTGLRPRDLANISAGIVMGLEVLEQRRILNVRASIFLFSDGKNNQGPNPLSISLKKFSDRTDGKITIHAFGYGDDVDLKLLEKLSSEGKGVFYHIREEQGIQNASALIKANISTVVARNLRVKVTVNSGPVRCSIPLLYTKEKNVDCFTLPDITANQQKDMIFMLKADYQTIPKATRFTSVTVVVQYEDNEGCDSMKAAGLDVRFVPWVDTAPSRDPSVFVKWCEVKGAYCLREARALAEQSHIAAGQRLKNEIELLQSSGYERHGYIASLIQNLEEALKLIGDNPSWQRGGGAHFASISYKETTSVLAAHNSPMQMLAPISKTENTK